jgi:glycerol uptake facilitator-like aquaporin
MSVLGKVSLRRRLWAEGVGTGFLVMIVVGSGIAAVQFAPGQVGIQLLANTCATILGLTVLIVIFGPVSGAHFNPVVSAADWLLGRRASGGFPGIEVAAYSGAQILGALFGAALANLMFELRPVQIATQDRLTGGHFLGEIVATAGLILVIFALVRSGRAALAAPVVGAYIGAAIWFTSSTSFANPAVTIGRILSDTFTGIAPSSVPGFIAAQVLGLLLGLGLVLIFYPATVNTNKELKAA